MIFRFRSLHTLAWESSCFLLLSLLFFWLVHFCFSLTQIFRDTASFWSLRTGLILHTQLRDACPTARILMWRSILCFRKTEDFLYLCGCEQKAHILNLLAVSHRIINIHGDSYGEKDEKCRGRRDVDSRSLPSQQVPSQQVPLSYRSGTLLVPAESGRNTPRTFQ